MNKNGIGLPPATSSAQNQNLSYLTTQPGWFVKKIFLLLAVLFHLNDFAFSQNTDNKEVSRFGGAITLTTKGISTIPSFTLGKPAVMFDLSMAKGKLSFEPQFRFALEGKPWTFIFWWRYKLLESSRFNLNLGAHPALSFKTIPVTSSGASKEVTIARRYFAGELSPSYSLSKSISVGMYYLYSHCLETDAVKNTHFVSLRGNFANINLSNQYFLKFASQIYYLKADKEDGFYVNSTLTLVRRNCPLSISSILNKTIESSVSGSKNFIWNVSLTYTFSKKYAKL